MSVDVTLIHHTIVIFSLCALIWPSFVYSPDRQQRTFTISYLLPLMNIFKPLNALLSDVGDFITFLDAMCVPTSMLAGDAEC